MKKLAILLCIVCMMTGCQSANQENQENQANKADKQSASTDELTAVASFYPIYILTLNVTDGVEGVTVKNLMTSQGGCAHDYQLTTDDLKALDSANLFLINGAGMEGFLEDVTNRYPTIETVDTSNGTMLVETEIEGEDNHAEDLDDHNDEKYNAHVWLSIPNAVKQTENIRDAFIRIDPDNEQKYRENTEKFATEMKALTAQMKNFDLAKREKAAVFHEGFDYFAEDFGFDIEVGLYTDENAAPSAKEVSEAIEDAKEEKISLYFAADDEGAKLAQTISAEAGGTVILLDPITGGENNKDAYKQAMEKNIAKLEEALHK